MLWISVCYMYVICYLNSVISTWDILKEMGMCLEASKCLDVGEGIQSVNTNLLTEEEEV